MAENRVTQFPVEFIYKPNSTIRVSQFPVEVIYVPNAKVKLAQFVVEFITPYQRPTTDDCLEFQNP
jgi:hypothetical protein